MGGFVRAKAVVAQYDSCHTDLGWTRFGLRTAARGGCSMYKCFTHNI